MKRSKNHTRSVDYEKTAHNLLKMRPFNPSTGSGRTGWLRLLVGRRSWLEIVSLRVLTRRKFCNVGKKKTPSFDPSTSSGQAGSGRTGLLLNPSKSPFLRGRYERRREERIGN